MDNNKTEGLPLQTSPENQLMVRKSQHKDIKISDIQTDNSENYQDFYYSEVEDDTPLPEILSIKQILNTLLADIQPVDFKLIVYPNPFDERQPTDRQKYVVVIEELLRLANERQWGICKNGAFVYVYNGAYWCLLDKDVLKKFLGIAAARMGIILYNAMQFIVKEHLFKQFMDTGFRVVPERNNEILINLRNGTLEIDKTGKITLLPFNKENFLKYMLHFEYNPTTQCPMFLKYLNECLPDITSQKVLAEYIGYIFIKWLKLEKVLILYGGGANGKSVFYDIICALLGRENISTYSMGNLCNPTGYFRAMIANKLLNYSSEIGSTKKYSTDLFKQLCSGEQIEARLPYGDPFLIDDYARFMFNANTLPKEIEHTDAFFRRFLIIPFNVTIPEAKRDCELAQKIIKNELSGVFNWVMAGLDRVVKQKGFTQCIAAEQAVKAYRLESDNVAMFLDENGYICSQNNRVKLKDLYENFKTYCEENNYRVCSNKEFAKRLRNKDFEIIKIRGGNDIYIEVRTDEEEVI